MVLKFIPAKSVRVSVRPDVVTAFNDGDQQRNQPIQNWRGQSGRVYAHRIYSLISCPPLGSVNYLLVHRYNDGTAAMLALGQTGSFSATANLAQLRHDAALCGANEIHVLIDEDLALSGEQIEQDLRAGQFNELIQELCDTAANAA